MRVLSRLPGLTLLVVCVLFMGCVPVGRNYPDPFVRALVFNQDPAIPLVPLPPPPLGQTEAPATRPVPQTPVIATPVSRNSASDPELPKTAVPQPPLPAPVANTTSTAASASTQPVSTQPQPLASPVLPVNTNQPAWARPGATVREIYQASTARLNQIDSYIARLARREVVRGTRSPDELILFKYRRSPMSIYLKWLGKEGAGREVTYVQGQHENKLHILLAAGDVPFVPAGRRMALAPDSILVRAASRHPIEEAGFASTLNHIGRALDSSERGDPRHGSVRVLGPLNRQEFDRPVLAIEHRLPPGLDASLPKGGVRTFFFHPTEGLPTLVICLDERNQEVEYYRYDRLQAGVKLDDADFSPDLLWGKQAPAASASR